MKVVSGGEYFEIPGKYDSLCLALHTEYFDGKCRREYEGENLRVPLEHFEGFKTCVNSEIKRARDERREALQAQADMQGVFSW